MKLEDPSLLSVLCDDGTRLSAHVFGNPQAASRLVVSHGNGLAAMGYRAFWEPLCEHFEVVVFDMRGHGDSEAGERSRHDWDQFVADEGRLIAALTADDPRPLVGAFHSLSAIIGLLHLARCADPAPWKALVLFDPPLTGPAGHPLARLHDEEMRQLAEVTSRRRRLYASLEDRAGQFMRTEVFGQWQEGAPLDMARATLRPAANGEWQLSCDPEREASIYATASHREPWAVLASPPCPIKLIAGDPTRPRPESPQLVCLLAHQQFATPFTAIEGTSHFLQLQQPQRCGQALLEFVGALT